MRLRMIAKPPAPGRTLIRALAGSMKQKRFSAWDHPLSGIASEDKRNKPEVQTSIVIANFSQKNRGQITSPIPRFLSCLKRSFRPRPADADGRFRTVVHR